MEIIKGLVKTSLCAMVEKNVLGEGEERQGESKININSSLMEFFAKDSKEITLYI